MKLSVKYQPTTLFSLKDSNSTNSGAKSLFLPSPYSIKMAILNQVITIGDDLEKLKLKNGFEFNCVKNANISYYIDENTIFSVNNCFVKILKPSRSNSGWQQTVSFREYIHISGIIEIIFEIENEEQKNYLKKYLHLINYFGKKGCFFQFLGYSDTPSEPNVLPFNSSENNPGILQEYDDFDDKAHFENVNNYSSKPTKRKKRIFVLPLQRVSSSKSFTVYKSF